VHYQEKEEGDPITSKGKKNDPIPFIKKTKKNFQKKKRKYASPKREGKKGGKRGSTPYSKSFL